MRKILVLMLLSTGPASGQFFVPHDGTSARLTVRTSVDSALVFLDGDLIGVTPITTGGLMPGLHRLRILHPDLASWNAPVIVDSVDLPAGQTTEKRYWFERQYIVQTRPTGAEVVLGSRVIGRTPLLVRPEAGDSAVLIRKTGYQSGTVLLDGAERNHLLIDLLRDPSVEPDRATAVDGGGNSRTLPLVLSGVSSVLAGGVSAYFKVQADQAYGEYLLTGDPRKLVETNKMDHVAGIALAASQVYFALFSYLLITQ